MNSRRQQSLMIIMILTAVLCGTGCSYLQDRATDARNVIDLGISVNTSLKPQFSCYFDFFQLVPIGYGNLDCKVLGLGNRQLGWVDYQNHGWGVLAVGRLQQGYGVFNPNDPEQARGDQRELTERPTYDTGFVGSFTGAEPPPPLQHIQCERSIHLGWIGIQNSMRPLAILDFILGWTTFDLLKDDHLAPPPEKKAEKK